METIIDSTRRDGCNPFSDFSFSNLTVFAMVRFRKGISEVSSPWINGDGLCKDSTTVRMFPAWQDHKASAFFCCWSEQCKA